jgi:small conductance mechanosensitive channel
MTQQLADQLLQIWLEWGSLIRVGIIIVLAVVMRQVLLSSVKRIVAGISTNAQRSGDELANSPVTKARVVQRAKTLGSVLSNFITWGLSLLALALVLSELGIAVGALVAGAGIIGAAVGFGAQSLVKDLISGLFIVFEDQYGVGDSVDLGAANGVVESVGLRVTQVRDVSGTLWYVRNGEILRVGNQSQGLSRAVIDVSVTANASVIETKAVLEKTVSEFIAKDTAKLVVGTAEVWGLEAISGNESVFRIVAPTSASNADDLARALRVEIKLALEKAKITLSSPINGLVSTGQKAKNG